MAVPLGGPARPGPEEDQLQAGAPVGAPVEVEGPVQAYLAPGPEWVQVSPPGEVPALWVAPLGTEPPVADRGLWQVVPPEVPVLAPGEPVLPLAELGQRWAQAAHQAVHQPVLEELARRQAQPAGVLELAQALREVAQQVGAQVAALAAALEQAAARVAAPVLAQVERLSVALAQALEVAADLEGALERGAHPAVALGPDPELAQPAGLGEAGLAGVLAPRGAEARPEAFLERAAQVLADQEALRAAALEQADLEERQEPAAPGEAYRAAEAALELADLVEPGSPALEALREAALADQEARQGVPARAVAPDPAVPPSLGGYQPGPRAAGRHRPGDCYQGCRQHQEVAARPVVSPGQEVDRLAGRPLAPGLVVIHRAGADPVIRYPSGAELDPQEAAQVELRVEAHPGLSPAQRETYRDLLAASAQLERQEAAADPGECPDRVAVYRHWLPGGLVLDPEALLRGLPGL